MSVDDDIEDYNFVGAFLKGKEKFQGAGLVLDKSLNFDDTLNFDKQESQESDNDVSYISTIESIPNTSENVEVVDISNLEDKKGIVELAIGDSDPYMRTRSRAKAIAQKDKQSPVKRTKNPKKRNSNNVSNVKPKKTRGRRGKSQQNVTTINLDDTTDSVPTIGLLLSSDDDFDIKAVESEEEEVNYEQRVLVKWNCGEIHRLSLRRFQKFTFIQDYFAKLEQCSPENVYIKLEDKHILPSDSIDSINLTVKDILDASVKTYRNPIQNSSTVANSNKLSFKIQYKNCKHPIHMTINSNDKMKVLMEKVREELAKPLSALFFEFDGEKLDGNKTAEDQDMFGGEIIDLRIKE